MHDEKETEDGRTQSRDVAEALDEVLIFVYADEGRMKDVKTEHGTNLCTDEISSMGAKMTKWTHCRFENGPVAWEAVVVDVSHVGQHARERDGEEGADQQSSGDCAESVRPWTSERQKRPYS